MKYGSDSDITAHVSIDRNQFCRFSNFNELRLNRRYLGLAAFFILLSLFGWCNLVTGNPLFCMMYILVGILVPSVYLCKYYLSINAQVKQLHLDEKPIEAYSIRFNPDGVFVSNNREQTSYLWEELSSAHRVNDSTYLYYSPKRAFILPDSSLEKATGEDLWNLLCEHISSESVKKWSR